MILPHDHGATMPVGPWRLDNSIARQTTPSAWRRISGPVIAFEHRLA
jgi:hypothetical protein